MYHSYVWLLSDVNLKSKLIDLIAEKLHHLFLDNMPL